MAFKSAQVLTKGLATVSGLYPFKKLNCVANLVNPVDDPRSSSTYNVDVHTIS